MKKIIFQLFFSILCWQTAFAQTLLPVRFAPEKDYGPFIYQDEQGRIQGLSWDILQALASQADLKITTLPAAQLADILEQAKLGQLDLISSLRPTPERAQFLNFTQPYVAVPAVLIVNQNDSNLTLALLQQQKVAVGHGYAVEPFVRSKYPSVSWVAVNDDRQALMMLREHKIKAFVADIASVVFIAKQEKYTDWRVAHHVGFQYQLSFAYTKTNTELGERLNQALMRLPLEKREALLARWLNAEAIESGLLYRQTLLWLALLLLSFALVYSLWLLCSRRRGADPHSSS